MPSRMIILPALVPFVGALVGCDVADAGSPPQEWAAICVDPRDVNDPNDDVRLDDDACGDYDDDGDSSHSSFFFLWSNTADPRPVPAVGSPAKGYGTHRHYPVGSHTVNRLPVTGAPAVRAAVDQAVKSNPGVRRGGFGVPAGAGKAGSKAGGSAGG